MNERPSRILAEAQFARVFQAAGCTTQQELAAILEIRQTSIANARRCGTVPDEWLLKLLRIRGVNPDWIMDGREPRFLGPANGPKETADPSPGDGISFMHAIDTLTVKKILQCFPMRDLVAELHRRKWRPR